MQNIFVWFPGTVGSHFLMAWRDLLCFWLFRPFAHLFIQTDNIWMNIFIPSYTRVTVSDDWCQKLWPQGTFRTTSPQHHPAVTHYSGHRTWCNTQMPLKQSALIETELNLIYVILTISVVHNYYLLWCFCSLNPCRHLKAAGHICVPQHLCQTSHL